jgi:hypothetical protein
METVVVIPLVLLLVLAIVQAAVWQHGIHVARAAAEQALTATRLQDGTTAAGHAAAEQVINQLGRGPLVDPTMRIERGADTVTVTIDATAESLLPLVHLPIHVRSIGVPEPPDPTAAGNR